MHGGPLMVAIVAAAFVLRTALVVVLRPASPVAAEFVDRWWVWIPLVVVILGAGYYLHPLVGAVIAITAAVLMLRDPHVGLPRRGRAQL